MNEFLKAHKKVRRGKKKLSDKDFIKFKSLKEDNLNSLGKFFSDKEESLLELKKIADDYNKKEYILKKYICVILPKGANDYRPILVPNPRDRILFSFILEKIKPKILQEINKYKVFGSGKRADFKNMKKILEEVYLESKKHKYVLKIDISKFFPSIERSVLFKNLEGLIDEPYIFDLIKKSFNNKIEVKFTKQFSQEKEKEIGEFVAKGIPQGCAYSPLLANFYGLPLDKLVTKEKLISFRYLDDMIIFVEDEDQARDIFKKLKGLARDELDMKIHEIDGKTKNKTYIQPANHTFEYLGMEIKRDGLFEIPLTKIRNEILLIKQGLFNINTIQRFGAEKVIEVLKQQIRGWTSFYRKNFPSSYASLKNKDLYNIELRDYYKKVLYSRANKRLKKAGFKIEDSSFYLF